MGAETGGKLFSLMHELLPSAVRYGLLIQPVGLVIGSSFAEEIRSAVAGVGGLVEVLTAGTIGEVDNAFASLVAKKLKRCLLPRPPFSQPGVSSLPPWRRAMRSRRCTSIVHSPRSEV
jgi:hypothetical protein